MGIRTTSDDANKGFKYQLYSLIDISLNPPESVDGIKAEV